MVYFTHGKRRARECEKNENKMCRLIRGFSLCMCKYMRAGVCVSIYMFVCMCVCARTRARV